MYFSFVCLFVFFVSATWWPGASSAKPIISSHEPPVQHPRGPESGQPPAREEPAATGSSPCPDSLPHPGPAETQLQPRVSHNELIFRVVAFVFH